MLKLVISSHLPLTNICILRSASQMVTIVPLKLAISSHFLLLKKSHSLFRLSQIARQMFDSELKTTNRICDWTVLLPNEKKKRSQIITNAIGSRKRLCMRLLEVISTTCENLQIAKHKSVRRSFHSPEWFALCDLQILSGSAYHFEQPHAQSLFLIPIVFVINLCIRSALNTESQTTFVHFITM